MKLTLRTTKSTFFHILISIVIPLFLLASSNARAQESVFSAFNYSIAEADKAFIAKNYHKALSIYQNVSGRDEAPENIDLRLARSYYFTFQYDKAVKHYQQYEKAKLEFPTEDYFYFAEALTSTGKPSQAIEYYQICSDKNPNNEMYSARIWRLSNLSYLYEDSIRNMAHYAKLNTPYSELQVVSAAEKEVYLVSNQPKVEIIKKVDSKENAPFYNFKKVEIYEDPFSIVALNYEDPKPGGDHLKAPFHLSAISIFDGGNQMVYAASSRKKNEKGNYPLQLYFAKKRKGKWLRTGDYEHNNQAVDMSEPTMSKDGKTLIFSANLPNSLGGRDLFKSVKTEEGWSPPENLGNSINTPLDERFPFIYESNLYLSSNGHPGLGGFDLFKVKFTNENFLEMENLGYPINSTYDELSFNTS